MTCEYVWMKILEGPTSEIFRLGIPTWAEASNVHLVWDSWVHRTWSPAQQGVWAPDSELKFGEPPAIHWWFWLIFDAFVQRKMGMCNSFKAWQAGRLVDARPGELTPHGLVIGGKYYCYTIWHHKTNFYQRWFWHTVDRWEWRPGPWVFPCFSP